MTKPKTLEQLRAEKERAEGVGIVSSVHWLFLGGQHKLSAIKSVTAVIQEIGRAHV